MRSTEKIIWLDKKFSNDIESWWTPEDTEDFVSLLNWRARLLFNGRHFASNANS